MDWVWDEYEHSWRTTASGLKEADLRERLDVMWGFKRREDADPDTPEVEIKKTAILINIFSDELKNRELSKLFDEWGLPQ